MGFAGEYTCTRCSASCDKEMLLAKQVRFQEIGRGAITFKSRVVDWLCPTCVANDEDWKRDEYESPGMRFKRKPQTPQRVASSAMYQKIKSIEDEN